MAYTKRFQPFKGFLLSNHFIDVRTYIKSILYQAKVTSILVKASCLLQKATSKNNHDTNARFACDKSESNDRGWHLICDNYFPLSHQKGYRRRPFDSKLTNWELTVVFQWLILSFVMMQKQTTKSQMIWAIMHAFFLNKMSYTSGL